MAHKPKTYIVDLDPTEGSRPPHKRVLIDRLDPTEYTREEYDEKLRERNINPEPWLRYDT